MKIFKTILAILVIFFQTGNVLSDKNIFNVNNIEIKKQSNSTNQSLANQAIKKAFNELKEKILMDEESIKLSNLDYVQIKELVSYYQVKSKKESASNDVIMYNIFFYNVLNVIFVSSIFSIMSVVLTSCTLNNRSDSKPISNSKITTPNSARTEMTSL